ncbi:MAG: SPOR domain-containing protein [Alphaproteobacteria bacterium]|nr:SPOR domain-containing protein [Alphaproteobacteria bacterium]
MMNEDQKPQDENIGSFYVGRRPPPAPERVLPKGGLSVIALIAFAAIVWYAYPTAQEAQEATDLPVVLAEKTAYKFAPDDPGGMKVPHQDSTVFDPLDKKDSKRVERLLPGTEEPVDKDTALKTGDTKTAPATAQMKKIGIETEKVITAAPAAASTETIKPVQKPAAKTAAADTDAKKQPPAEPAKPAVQASAPATTASGGVVYIQLGSYRNTEGAATDWKKLQQKHPDLLKGLDMRTQRVDLGDRGVFNRLQAGKVSETRAKEICDVLKSANPGGCMVVR